MKELDFTEIIKNIPNARLAKQRISARKKLEEDFIMDEYPVDYYSYNLIAITHIYKGTTKTKYVDYKADAFEWLQNIGYSDWYINRALENMPYTLIGPGYSYYIQELPAGIDTSDMWRLDIDSDRFEYFIDNSKCIFRTLIKTGVTMELTVTNGKIRLGGSTRRISIDKIWNEMRIK